MRKTIIIISIISTLSALFPACSGSRATIRFENLKYPCSTSAFLYGPNQEILVKGKDLKTVGFFQYEKKYWGILWSALRLSDSKDVMQKMNQEIINKNGEGIINLTVVAETHKINNVIPLNVLPIWPGATNVKFYGEIVRRKNVN